MKKITIIVLFLCEFINAFSQSLSQSSNRSSSLLFGVQDKSAIAGTAITANNNGVSFPSQLSIDVTTKDKKLEVNNQYNLQLGTSSDFLVFGLTAAGKMNNSFASFFNNNNIVGGAEAALLIGVKLFSIKNRQEISDFFVANINNMTTDELERRIGEMGKINGHWFYINPSIEGRQFKRITPTNGFDTQISKEKNSLWGINFGYNYWNPSILGINTLMGVSFTPKFVDNFGDLDEITVTDEQVVTNGTTYRTITSKITTYQGDYGTKKQRDLNFEMYMTPNKMPFFGILLGHQTTYEKDKESLSKFTAGIYFCKEKQPLNPSIGVHFIFTDIYNNYDLDKEKKFGINVVTRLPLGRGVN